MHCIRTILSIILIALAFASCQPSTPMPSTDEFIIWKGNLESAPDNPEAGWTYYNTTEGATYIFLQDEWRRIASDGLDINWLGEYESAPVNPERNDAYFNSIDGNSYIFDGTEWDYLAKKGEDGTSGILKWYGERTSHISSPKDGDAYHNTIDSKSYIYYSGSWHVLSEDGEDGYGLTWLGTFSSHPSGTHEINSIYYNTTDGVSYIWTGTSWDVFNESNSQYITVPVDWQGSLSYAPSNPEIGWTYYNTTTKASYIYDGSVWQQIAKDGSDAVTPEGYLMQWRGTYSSHPSGAQPGWAYYNTRNNAAYIYDGSAWNVLVEGGSTSGSSETGGSSDVSHKAVFEVLVDDKVISFGETIKLGNYVYGDSEPINKTIVIKNTGNGNLRFAIKPEEYVSSSNTSYKGIIEIDESNLPDVIAPGKEGSFNIILSCTEDSSIFGSSVMIPLGFEFNDGTVFHSYIGASLYGPMANVSIVYSAPYGYVSDLAQLGVAGTMYKSLDISDVETDGEASFQLTVSSTSSGSSPDYQSVIKKVSVGGADNGFFKLEEGSSSILYTLILKPDSSRIYKAEINVTVEYNGNEVTLHCPLSVECNYITTEPVEPSKSFFDCAGYAYFDSGEGDGNDRFSLIVPKTDGGKYIVGTGWEYLSDYSEDDFIIIELDEEDNLVGTYACDEAMNTNIMYPDDAIARDDGKVLFVGDIYYSCFDVELNGFVSGSSISTGCVLIGVRNGYVWYASPTKFMRYHNLGTNDSIVAPFEFKLNQGFSVVNDAWCGTIDGKDSVILVGYGTNLIDEHSKKDAVVQLYQYFEAEDTWSFVRSWVWDNGHSDDENALSVTVDENGRIYVGVYGYDYINGWTSGYYVNQLSADDEAVISTLDLPLSATTAILYQYNNNVYVDYGVALGKYQSQDNQVVSVYNSDDFRRKEGRLVFIENNIYYGYSSYNAVNAHSNQDWVIRKAVIE